jgi:hypothetical protein
MLSADTLTLRDGETIRGTFLGGSSRDVRMDLNGQIRTFDLGQVQSITFDQDSSQGYPAPPPAQRPPSYPNSSYPNPSNPNSSYPNSSYPSASSGPVMRRAPGSDSDSNSAPPPPPVTAGTTIPANTQLTVRMIDAVDSEKAYQGQTFRASLDEPVVVNGQEVIPRGADVLTKLVQDQQSGKIEGKTILTLAVQNISINGRPVDVTTTDVQTASSSRGKRSAGVVGGGAALGAIIGAIAGGGKGAAIGAGSGAAIGAGTEVLTGGQKVKIPSETRLTFRLQNPVQL